MKKTLFFIGGLIVGIGQSALILAENTEAVQSDINTSVLEEKEVVIRPNIDTPILRKQFNAKRLYREAWDADNGVQLSTIDQLEYIQANNPGLDEDTMAVVKQGTDLLKKMKFGLKDADISADSVAIYQDPTKVITQISDNTLTEATPQEAMTAIDLMEPSKRMIDKVFTDKTLGRKGYQINIDSF